MMTKEEVALYKKQYYIDNKSAYKQHYIDNKSSYNRRSTRDNCKRMYVHGKYISKKHPLWKSGKYKSFDDAAFSSLVNYEHTIAGDVYIITNAAWPEWVKVGKAIDAKDRLKSYQTSDPHRDYKLYYHKAHANRHIAETGAHKALEKLSEERKNEWFKVDLETAVSCVEASYE